MYYNFIGRITKHQKETAQQLGCDVFTLSEKAREEIFGEWSEEASLFNNVVDEEWVRIRINKDTELFSIYDFFEHISIQKHTTDYLEFIWDAYCDDMLALTLHGVVLGLIGFVDIETAPPTRTFNWWVTDLSSKYQIPLQSGECSNLEDAQKQLSKYIFDWFNNQERNN